MLAGAGEYSGGVVGGVMLYGGGGGVGMNGLIGVIHQEYPEEHDADAQGRHLLLVLLVEVVADGGDADE